MNLSLRAFLSNKVPNIDLREFERPIKINIQEITNKIKQTDGRLASIFNRIRKESEALILSEKFSISAKKIIQNISALIRKPNINIRTKNILVNIISALSNQDYDYTLTQLMKISDRCKISGDPALIKLSSCIINFRCMIDGSEEISTDSINNFKSSFNEFEKTLKIKTCKISTN